MKRIRTKHNGSGRRKMVQQATNDAVGYMLPIFYIALKDELNLSVEEVRRVKVRIDRYSDYITQGLISFDDIRKDLKKAGYGVKDF